MANQYISKVVLGTETLIDLTDSTVTPATLMLGTVAYGADGSRLVGEHEDVDGDSLGYGAALVGSAVVGTAVIIG